jgi:Rrf2 family protein
MLSLTAEYALRAMVFLAKNPDSWPVPAPRIAEQVGIPPKYLSTILADLVRAGLLDGTRGKSGGFRMTRSPKQIRLSEVLAPFEPRPTNRRACPFGNVVCDDADPCAGHERWKKVKAAYDRFLQETTVFEVAVRRTELPSDSGNGRRAP